MNIKALKDKIISANAAYRAGTPIMEDSEFDKLLEAYEQHVEASEFQSFVNTLHEVKGKVKHPFILGSLNKLKAEEPEKVMKFIHDNVSSNNKLNISAKIDGISCRIHYVDGKLVSASTRGNGEFGEDLTDKIAFVQNVPKKISLEGSIDIRGELVILKDEFAEFSFEFANPRNATAGFMNRKDWNKDDIKHVSFIAYTILGSDYSKTKQFSLLDKNGFTTAWHKEIPNNEANDQTIVDKLVKFAEQSFDYETDGLVLCSSQYLNEDKYRPDTCVAFKINQQIAETTLLDVVFEGPAKNGTHAPVSILDPVELGGVIISRASVYNIDAIEKMGLKYGSVVKLLRSGDVIPKIIEVVSTPKDAEDIKIPEVCNCCGSKLVREGAALKCLNKQCKDKQLWWMTYFIKNLGVKSISEGVLKNLEIYSIKDLLAFRPNSKSKTQMKLDSELKLKVFSRSKKELLGAMNFDGLGATSIYKIIDFYGFDNIERHNFIGLPDGIGEILLDRFKNFIDDNLADLELLTSDCRYSFVESAPIKAAVSNGMSVCFTGKLNTIGRTEAEKLAIEAGFEVKSVNKKLTYLVTNDPDTNSGKGKKARELGIKIISENDFLKMISDNMLEQDIGDL